MKRWLKALPLLLITKHLKNWKQSTQKFEGFQLDQTESYMIQRIDYVKQMGEKRTDFHQLDESLRSY